MSSHDVGNSIGGITAFLLLGIGLLAFMSFVSALAYWSFAVLLIAVSWSVFAVLLYYGLEEQLPSRVTDLPLEIPFVLGTMTVLFVCIFLGIWDASERNGALPALLTLPARAVVDAGADAHHADASADVRVGAR